MSKYETGVLLVIVLAWLSSLLIQWVILSRQNTFQRKTTELQNSLGARREIAAYKLENLLLMAKWLDQGLELQAEMFPFELFLKDDEGNADDPDLENSKIVSRILAWTNSAKKLIILAQIYDPKTNKSASAWDDQLNGELPEDLPQLLVAFKRVLGSYVWNLLYEYDQYELTGLSVIPLEEDLVSLIPEAGKYIIPVYQKSQVALERVKEFVATKPLLSS